MALILSTNQCPLKLPPAARGLSLAELGALATLMSMLALLPICAAMLRSAPLPIVTLAPAVSRPALLPRGVLTAGTAQARVRPAVRMFAEPPPEDVVPPSLVDFLHHT